MARKRRWASERSIDSGRSTTVDSSRAYHSTWCSSSTAQHTSRKKAHLHPPHESTMYVNVSEMSSLFLPIPGYSRVLPGLLIPVTDTSSPSYSLGIGAPGTQVPGYSSDQTFEVRGTATHHPSSQVPWGHYFVRHRPGNLFHNENTVSCLSPFPPVLTNT